MSGQSSNAPGPHNSPIDTSRSYSDVETASFLRVSLLELDQLRFDGLIRAHSNGMGGWDYNGMDIQNYLSNISRAPIASRGEKILTALGSTRRSIEDAILGEPESRGGRMGHPDSIPKRMITRRGMLGELGTAAVAGSLYGATKIAGHAFGSSAKQTQNAPQTQSSPSNTPTSASNSNTPGSLQDPSTGTQIFNALMGDTTRERTIRPLSVHTALKVVHGMCNKWREKQKKAGLDSSQKARKAAILDMVEVERVEKSMAKGERMRVGAGANEIARFDAAVARVAALETELHELEAKEKEQTPHLSLQLEQEAMPSVALGAEGLVALWDLYDLLSGRDWKEIMPDVPYAIIRIIEHFLFYFQVAPRGKENTPEQISAVWKTTRRGLGVALLAGLGVAAYKTDWAGMKNYLSSQNMPWGGASSAPGVSSSTTTQIGTTVAQPAPTMTPQEAEDLRKKQLENFQENMRKAQEKAKEAKKKESK